MTLHELTDHYKKMRAARDAANQALDAFEKAQFEAAQELTSKTRIYCGTCDGYAIVFKGHGETSRGHLYDFIPCQEDEHEA